jgi:hypothetical protein
MRGLLRMTILWMSERVRLEIWTVCFRVCFNCRVIYCVFSCRDGIGLFMVVGLCNLLRVSLIMK